MKDLIFVIIALVVIGFIWLFTGGPTRIPDDAGIFLGDQREEVSERIQPGSGSALDEAGAEQRPEREDSVSLTAAASKQRAPNKEYVTVRASGANKNPVNVTGWRLENGSGNSVAIERADALPYPSREGAAGDILLAPGDTLYVITGRSPLGYNFRTNLCIGYFQQNTTFVPALPEQCPLLEDEVSPHAVNDLCLDFIEDVSRCTTPTNNDLIERRVEPVCREIVLERTQYGWCVDQHRNDANFRGGAWYVYLGRLDEFWKERRETITLRDGSGSVVDSISY